VYTYTHAHYVYIYIYIIVETNKEPSNSTRVYSNPQSTTCFGYVKPSSGCVKLYKIERTTVTVILLKIVISVFVTSIIFIPYNIKNKILKLH
jgi:hypothetical protein